MLSKKDTVYLFKEGTETNLSRQINSQYALARHQDVAQALVKFFNEDSEQKKMQKSPKPISFEYNIYN